MTKELCHVIEQISREKGIAKETMVEAQSRLFFRYEEEVRAAGRISILPIRCSDPRV